LPAIGHPEQSLPDMRRADAVCAQYRRPAGVTFIFQVCKNSVEPAEPNRSLNLFAKDRVRSTLSDEPKPLRPQMPLVSSAALFACGAERLAGTTSGPYWTVSGPSGEVERERPPANSGEPVILSVASHVVGAHVADVALANVAAGNKSGCDEIA
jgi:hypothetical protein